MIIIEIILAFALGFIAHIVSTKAYSYFSTPKYWVSIVAFNEEKKKLVHMSGEFYELTAVEAFNAALDKAISNGAISIKDDTNIIYRVHRVSYSKDELVYPKPDNV